MSCCFAHCRPFFTITMHVLLLCAWPCEVSIAVHASLSDDLFCAQSVVGARPATRQSVAASHAQPQQPHAQAPRVLDPRRAAAPMDPRLSHTAPAPYVAPPVMAGAGYGVAAPFTAPPSPPSRPMSAGELSSNGMFTFVITLFLKKDTVGPLAIPLKHV